MYYIGIDLGTSAVKLLLMEDSGKMKERRIKIWKDFQEMFSPCVINGTGQICKLKKYPTKLYL